MTRNAYIEVAAAQRYEASFMLFRVISWIDFGVNLKAIHELTRTNTKTDVNPGLISYSFSDFLCKVTGCNE